MTNQRRGEKEEVLARLRRVEGQIRGIQRMVRDDRDCEAIITQLMAARAALDKAGILIVTRDIERCLVGAPGEAGSGQLDRVIEFFLKFADTSQAGEMQDEAKGEDDAQNLPT